VGDECHAERGRVEVGRLFGVVDVERKVVPAFNGEVVCGNVVLNSADELGIGDCQVSHDASKGRQDVVHDHRCSSMLGQVCQEILNSLHKTYALLASTLYKMSNDSFIDELDGRLIRLLSDYPRIGVLECARRLGVA